jgi:predicted nucleic acid-binding protein
MRNILLDTGAFVALIDKSENNYERCVEFFSNFKGKLLTSEPVLTETLCLLNSSMKAQRACIEFILKGGADLIPQSPKSLSRTIGLMEKYVDIPMDFADATLVVLAEEIGTDEIFTLDKRGFNAYRFSGRKTFKIWPE